MHEKLWRLVRLEKAGREGKGEVAERHLLERHFQASQESIERRVGPVGGRYQASPGMGSLEDARNSVQSKRIDRLGRNSQKDAEISNGEKRARASRKMAACTGASV